MKERLSTLLSVKGLTALRFAEIMDVQPSSISHILSGRNNPNYDFMLKLVERFPDISPDWMFLGQGEMFRTLSTPDTSTKQGIIPEIEENESEDGFSDHVMDEITVIDDVKPLESAELKDKSDVTTVNDDVKVTKVIIFYSNGTFESFTQK